MGCGVSGLPRAVPTLESADISRARRGPRAGVPMGDRRAAHQGHAPACLPPGHRAPRRAPAASPNAGAAGGADVAAYHRRDAGHVVRGVRIESGRHWARAPRGGGALPAAEPEPVGGAMAEELAWWR